MNDLARCDLHVHSRASTDSGSYAIRRARLAESYTDPARVAAVARARGMSFVTLSDHNTLEGALRIAHLPGAFLSVEVTTCFPEDELPLHVLVWNLDEEDHRELQEWRPSVYDLVDFLRERRLHHALAHPLYRMGPPIAPSHVERMMMLFGVWEGRNGARPAEQNTVACRLAASVTPDYLAKLANRHGLEPRHDGWISLCGGSDDHAALDIATTWTSAPGTSPAAFLDAVCAGHGDPGGAHGSTAKLAHALAALSLNAWREAGHALPAPLDTLAVLFDEDAPDACARHGEIEAAARLGARAFSARARAGKLDVASLGGAPSRVAALLAAGAIQAPYLATAFHHADSRADVPRIAEAFFGPLLGGREPRALVFTDTYDETNGVATTMRRLASAATHGSLPVRVAIADAANRNQRGVVAIPPDWELPLPTYESITLRFPAPVDVLGCIESERPDVVHVATPGPLGLLGLLGAKLLGIPTVGSYHTELGPYALHLTRDALMAGALGSYVDLLYRQCDLVLAPTHRVAADLRGRGYREVDVWGRAADTLRFAPERRDDDLRARLLAGGDLLLVSVGRLSPEKRVDVLLASFAQLRATAPGARLAIAGDGPARATLEAAAPPGVTFLGEVLGDDLARLYASGDVFCFPSTTDTFGQVLLEAAASALPAVVANAGGAPEVVAADESAVLVPGGDVEAMTRALAGLAASPERRFTMGAAARRLAEARSWEQSIGELTSAYAAACAARADARHPVAVG